MVKLLTAFILLFLIANISFSSVNNALAQNSTSTENPTVSNQDLLLLNINLNRIDTQLDILLNKININNQIKISIFV